jgi:hypothetical protein
MRLRIVLPIFNVILAIVLLRVGDSQASRFWNERIKFGPAEPMPDSYARARYLDYAINAPAWATLGEPRGLIWSDYKQMERDTRYLLAVIIMWYLVGLQFDRNSRVKRDGALKKRWIRRILGLACMLYGLFLYRLMIPEFDILHDSVNGFCYRCDNTKFGSIA